MSIYFTDSGLEKIYYEIIGFVYQYLKLLQQKSPQEWIYKELQDIANMDFTFAEEQPQDEYICCRAFRKFAYLSTGAHYIYGDYAYKSFNKSQDVQSEPWFGSQYKEESIPPEIDVALHLPAKNEFIPIPKDFSICANGVMCDSADVSPPECIIDEVLVQARYVIPIPTC
ncbi:unnamed protein product [Lactuca virosa]|uniref:Peptidase M16 middle/third domain-containing protein n=1 Tax=Lactuca virosa TaxID=75947 RepID=A0AAU9PBA7_9ASTR|nr:unnamed protein product [Lactuca virosa]